MFFYVYSLKKKNDNNNNNKIFSSGLFESWYILSLLRKN